VARPIRLDPEDGWHHVMNRGASRQRTFFAVSDGDRFLALIHEGCELLGIEIHAFCLMPNHFHLLVHVPHAGLSAFMQRLGSQYTRYVNDRRGSDGALFRGRFRSIVVDDVSYRSVVGRYIHRNPIALEPVDGPSSYRWSSLRHYLNEPEPPTWLRTDVLLTAHTSLSTFCDYTLGVPYVAPSASIVRWAIDLALHEVFDESEPQFDVNASLQRTVAVLMLNLADRLAVDLVAAINELLCFPNRAAFHSATYRARRRVEAEPILNSVAMRALQLCDMTKGV
jgi:REP element-mobilizing transposase RayT